MRTNLKRKRRDAPKMTRVKQEEQVYDLNFFDLSPSSQYDSSPNAPPKAEDDLDIKFDADGEKLPGKKQRIFVEIRVPTLKEVHQQKLNKAALDKSSEVKKKKGAPDIVLSDTVRDSRLALINHHVFEVKVPAAIKDQQVTREFMATTYGGSMQATRPKIKPSKVLRHGYDKFAYLHICYHPHAPRYPGQNGLFYSTKSGQNWDGIYKVFTRDSKKASWWYDGEYESIAGPALTIDEWKLQAIEVRAHWATQICSQKWGQHVRSRILTRRELGRSGTAEEVEAVRKSGRWEAVAALDVMKAYDVGEEAIGVWILKCVGYDEAFQRELCDKFPRWVKPRPKQPKPQDTKKSTKQRNAKGSPSAKQSKRETSFESSSVWDAEIEDGDLTDDASAELEPLPLMRRGTRSRPRIV